MPSLVRQIVAVATAFRLVPHLIYLLLGPASKDIHADVERWSAILFKEPPNRTTFLVLMTFFPEFRSLVYARAGLTLKLFRFLCPPLPSLLIVTKKIGPGLFIQHGLATIIAAESIGSNCWVNQQVTIGFIDAKGSPRIGNNVRIGAGAKVLGAISVGDNVVAGANAVVLRDVPANVTMGGVPAKIIKDRRRADQRD